MAALKALLVVLALGCSPSARAQPVDNWSGEIAEAAARFGIPTDWVRQVIRVESNGQTMLKGQPTMSSAGAMGLMQLMPGTWREIRAQLGLGFDPFEPRDNILAGTAYLRLMYDRFGYPGLFAAYNAGPARYAAWRAGRRRLPHETQLYMATVAQVSRSPFEAGRRRASPMLVSSLLGRGAAIGAVSLRPVSAGLFVPLKSTAER